MSARTPRGRTRAPACYRAGGPLTVTDANVMLGRIQPAHFPRFFGPDGDQPLDHDVVRRRFAELAGRIRDDTGDSRTPEQVAEGFLQVAVANMAAAVKRISVQKGHDVTAYALTTFGGAGGQHACAVADSLGIRTVLVPPMAGVLSALGIGLADTTTLREQSVELPLEEASMQRIRTVAGELEAAARAVLRDEDVPVERIRVARRARLRYDGTDTAVPVELAEPSVMAEEFAARHRALYSFLLDRPVTVEALSVEATGLTRQPDLSRLGEAVPEPGAAPDTGTHPLYTGGAWHDAPLRERERLRPGTVVTGPAVITEANATTVVDPGWQATSTAAGHLLVERVAPTAEADVETTADPVLLEIFNSLFVSIAEQMGARLESTAQSVNIKERLDFSCALFDPDGNLVANAPHIPVHLGSMGTAVREVIRRRPGTMRPGDAYAVNDPYHGGHAPSRRHGGDPGLRRTARSTRHGDPVLRGLPRSPRGNRRADAGVDAGEQPRHRRRGRALRQLAPRRERPLPGGRDAATPHRRPLSVPQPRHQPRRPAGPDRRQPQRRRGGRQDDRPLRAGRGAGLHASRPAERRGSRPPGGRLPHRRRVPLRDGFRCGHLRTGYGRP
ncbi:hypothetical protein GCM10020000_04130 [Streptomyces olivoverticillatus]